MQILTYKNHQSVDMYRFGYSTIGKPLLSVYCYKIDDLLIDTAQRNCEHKVLKTFADLQINTILLTHWHEDHSGNVTSIAAKHDARVIAPKGCVPYLNNGFSILPYEHYLFGQIKPYSEKIEEVSCNIVTKNYSLTPIFSPGHSEDHTVYLEQNNGWLFSGDLFVGVEIKIFRRDEKFWQQVESFKEVLTYDFDVLFCGHHPRLKNGKKWLQRKLQYFEDFGGRVQELHFKGLNTKAILKEMKLKENNLVRLLISDDASVKYMIEAAKNLPKV